MPRARRRHARSSSPSSRRVLGCVGHAQISTNDNAAPALETLERRLVMCAMHQAAPPVELRPDLVGQNTVAGGPEATADIRWTNRGQSSDGFTATFGANAEPARRVMDAVIESFERMIGSFNYSDGSTTFNLNVNMGSNDNGASAGLGFVLGGKPKSGTITMGRGSNGQGSGWFIDPTPNEHSEFMGNIVNAFAADAHAGSPAAGLGDFYTVAAAEMTHLLGLYGSELPMWSSKTTNTGVSDTAEGGGIGTFYVFRGPSIKHLLTSNNGGPGGFNWGSAIHGAGPNVNVTFQGDTYQGAQDIGNANYEFARRYIPGRTFALMFKDAFNYSTVDPSTFGTFYSVLDQTTGRINVRGTGGADHVTVSLSGTTLSVSVDPKSDVPGTGHLAGAGDAAAFVTEYDVSQVTSLVINAAEGADVITVAGLPVGLSVTVNAEGGNDTINIAGVASGATLDVFAGSGDDTFSVGGGDVYNNIAGTLNLDGQVGTDTVLFDDSATTDGAEYTIDATAFAKAGFAPLSFTGAEGVGVKANNQANVIHVLATGADRPINVQAGGGDDTINVGGGVLGDLLALVTVDGQAGSDTVVVNDSLTPSSDLYFVDGTTVSRAGFGGVTTTGSETLRLVANAGNSTVVVTGTAVGVNLVVNGGTGADTITVEETNPASPVLVQSSAGIDTVNVNADSTGTAAVRFVSGGVTRLNNVVIRAGGSAVVAPGGDKVIVASGNFSITGGGRLDLADNALVLDHNGATPITTVRNLLTSGYAAGAWNGVGIHSSVAAADATRKQTLGFAEASDVFSAFPATLAGVEVDNTAVLVRHTVYGDVNLDRAVNLTDFNRLAANFGATSGGWSRGDLNYDGAINLADFNLLAGNFGAMAATASVASVPEVTTVGTTGPRKRGSSART